MAPSPKRKPGPKSKTKGRGESPPEDDVEPPGSYSSEAGSSRSQTKVYKCTFCGRIFSDLKDLARHKKTEHADQCTHITGASSVSQFVAPTGRARRTRVAAGAPDGDGSDGDENNSPPPSPKKRNKRQGRNRSPLPIGKKKRVKGPDGVVRDEIERGPRFTSG